MSVEVVLGLIAKSMAILTDAADLLSDSAGFIINIVAIAYAKKAATQKLTFGYLKVEALGAFISIILIWVLYTLLIKEAIEAITEGGEDIDIGIMFGLSCCAFVLNIVKICIAGGHTHGGGGGGEGGHEHGGGKKGHGDHGKGGHEHDEGKKEEHAHGGGEPHGGHDNKKTEHGGHEDGGEDHGGHGDKKEEAKGGDDDDEESAGMRVAFINLFGDVFKSFGIVVLSVILFFKDDWKILDPIYTIVVSILVIISTFGLTGDTFKILIEATPSNINIDALKKELMKID